MPVDGIDALDDRDVLRLMIEGELRYLDPSLTPEQRADDLLARMSLAKKVGQMTQINATRLQGDPNNDWDRGAPPQLRHPRSRPGSEPGRLDPLGWRRLTRGEQPNGLDRHDQHRTR